jgi:nucleotide-binding universal stress UspA family protein
MDAPIVVLNDYPASSTQAVAYSAQLAKVLAVRLRLLHTDPDACASPGSHQFVLAHTRLALHRLAQSQPVPTDVEVSAAALPAAVEETTSQHHALLLALERPAFDVPIVGLVATALHLLQTTACPLLIVPSQGPVHVPPRRIALAADGEPFTLGQGLKTLHALTLTLPTQLTVVHAHLPHTVRGGDDALRTVRACGLATRFIPTDLIEVPSRRASDGILAGVQRIQADLLVLVVRRRSATPALFHRSITAKLLKRSLVPVLLMLAQDP